MKALRACRGGGASEVTVLAYLAADELLELEYAHGDDELVALLDRVTARRQDMDEVSLARYRGMAWEHGRIQQLFDYLDKPLH